MPSGMVGDVWVHDLGGPDDGPSIVLLHGFSDSGECWADAVRRWAGRYRLWSVDARGHGRSTRFSPAQLAGWPAEVMVDDTVGVLERLAAEGTSRPVLVGHSMGGGVAAGVALQRPGLVAGLVLEDPALGTDPEDGGDAAADRHRWGAEQVARLQRVRDDPDWGRRDGVATNPGWPEVEREPWLWAKLATDLGLAASGRIRPPDPWPRTVASLDVPSLLVTGTEDVLWAGPALAELRRNAGPRLRVEVVPGAGHCVRRTRTRAFHALVDPWLADLTAPTPTR